jgi:hypothetical protein
VTKTIDRLELGQKLEVLMQTADGEVLGREVLEVVQTPGPGDPSHAYRLESRERTVGRAEGVAPDAPAELEATSPFDVLKFAWDFIKDGKPVNHTDGAQSFVLYKDTDPLDYANSREGHSGTAKFIVRDATFKDVILIEVDLFLEGAYHATPNPKHDIPQGHYLPSIYFGIPTCHVNFPFIELEGSASLGQPYNVGGHDDVQPRVKAYAKFTVTVFWSSHTWSYGYVADGTDGFKFTGPV